MSMTVVPISIVLVFSPQPASSGNGDPPLARQVVTRKWAPSAARLLGRDGGVDGVQERVGPFNSTQFLRTADFS